MQLILLDNYDSFTWNLAHYLAQLGAGVDVVLNDAMTVDEILDRKPDALVISPGPGRSEDAGCSIDLVRGAAGRVPLLGVCLGHQAIAAAYGGRIARAPTLMHGKTSSVRHDGRDLYRGLPAEFDATRYHSLVVDPASLPDELIVDATTDDGVIMGIRHREHVLHGVQFHPESILTYEGRALLANFLEIARSAISEGERAEVRRSHQRSALPPGFVRA